MPGFPTPPSLSGLFLVHLALVVLYVQFTKSEAAMRNQVRAARTRRP